jgi:hypothetical protein
MAEDVRALLEVAVHECNWRGVACCRNWSEAGHVLAQLNDEMRRIALDSRGWQSELVARW